MAERVTEIWTEWTWTQVLFICYVNQGITIISTIGVIKGFTTSFVSHSMAVNEYIFCARNRIGFTKMRKVILYGRERGNAFKLGVLRGDKNPATDTIGISESILKTIILKFIECRAFKTPSGILHIIKISHKDSKWLLMPGVSSLMRTP